MPSKMLKIQFFHDADSMYFFDMEYRSEKIEK